MEECEEEEIIVDSDDEADENVASGIQRAVTPTPIQDFGANTVYTEGINTHTYSKMISPYNTN